jgi:acyl-CoA-binding protein
MVQQQTEVLGPSQSGAISLPYPDRFFAAASFAGFAPASQMASKSSSISLSDDTTLLLYSLYQQATVGPCNVAKPWSWNVVEHAKWTSWNQLAKMPSTEAMRLFVRTLEVRTQKLVCFEPFFQSLLLLHCGYFYSPAL